MRLVLLSCLTYAAAAARVTSDADSCACRELGDDVHTSRLLKSGQLDDTSIRTAVQLWFTDQEAAEATFPPRGSAH